MHPGCRQEGSSIDLRVLGIGLAVGIGLGVGTGLGVGYRRRYCREEAGKKGRYCMEGAG